MREKRRLFNVRLNNIEMTHLDNISDYTGLTRSDCIRMLLRNFVKRINVSENKY